MSEAKNKTIEELKQKIENLEKIADDYIKLEDNFKELQGKAYQLEIDKDVLQEDIEEWQRKNGLLKHELEETKSLMLDFKTMASNERSRSKALMDVIKLFKENTK